MKSNLVDHKTILDMMGRKGYISQYSLISPKLSHKSPATSMESMLSEAGILSLDIETEKMIQYINTLANTEIRRRKKLPHTVQREIETSFGPA